MTKRPGSRVQIPLGSLPGRLFPCLQRSIASRVRLENHASKRCYIQPRALPQALPQAQSYIQYTDITRSSCPDFPRARGSLGCQQPHQIYLFTRILGQWKPTYLCHSDPTNSQLYYMWTMWCVWLKFKKDSDLLFIFSPSVASWGMTKIRSVTRLYKRVGPYSIYVFIIAYEYSKRFVQPVMQLAGRVYALQPVVQPVDVLHSGLWSGSSSSSFIRSK